MDRQIIHYAAVCKGPGPLNYLISQNVPVFVKDKHEMTPIMLAAKYGRT